jgi:REP element-mobilizing transposase RayT
MSNHVHYLLEPSSPEDLPKIMHWLNWYTAMCFNRMLNRTGHFWEKRYHSSGFETSDYRRALNTLGIFTLIRKPQECNRDFSTISATMDSRQVN